VAGIYVHLPFCPYICPYCDFAKWPHRASLAKTYLRALESEIGKRPAVVAETLFLGGGTPNAYSCADVAGLVRVLRARFAFVAEPEVTIELNPELVRGGDFETYREAGITRLSIGVQSFDEREIATLGRRHTAEQVTGVVEMARLAEMGSVSIDLMFGTPGQTPATWTRSVRRAIDLNVDHVSTYGLTVEAGTPYAQWRAREPAVFPDDGLEAELYAVAIEELAAAGYEHYEISNFARPGHRSRHNANYWDNGEYVGLGVGAASYMDGVRSVHTRELGKYVEAALVGADPTAESERLEGTRRVGEAIMLALRTAQGVSRVRFKERYNLDVLEFYKPVVRRFCEAGLLEVDETGFRLTHRGRFLANDVCAGFINAA
jgi:oxygen-independent coproporphyrinogen-3 oxidase